MSSVSGPKTNNGVDTEKAQTLLNVKKDSKGLTLEQRNIIKSYEVENKPGAVKHLYVISPYNGKILLYSTVDGKVTSNTKGLTPSTIATVSRSQSSGMIGGMPVKVHGYSQKSNEVMNESGTYGSSLPPYIYWWDVRGVYHKHYVTGGQMIHISNQPMVVRDVVINIETMHVK
jgi:hypothetical protein